jgi:hemoglobin-like flavoprotein
MDIRDSIGQIFDSGTKLTDRFYEIFLERCPQAGPHFEGADMQSQSVMLTMALGAVREHPKIKNGFKAYLRVLGTRHRRRNIPQEMYGEFAEALLATLEEFHGQDWDDALADQWRAAIGDVEKLMFEGYHKDFRV